MPLILALLGVVLLNVAATVKVLRENRGPSMTIGSYVDDPGPRRWGQISLVWLLPVLGALVIFTIYAPHRRRPADGHVPAEPHPYVMQDL